MDILQNSATPLACNLSALTVEQQKHHGENTHMLFTSYQQIVELPDGVALSFPFSVATCVAITDFMTLEHLCCPFFRLSLEVESGAGNVWLRLQGSPDVKAFIQAEMNLQ